MRWKDHELWDEDEVLDSSLLLDSLSNHISLMCKWRIRATLTPWATVKAPHTGQISLTSSTFIHSSGQYLLITYFEQAANINFESSTKIGEVKKNMIIEVWCLGSFLQAERRDSGFLMFLLFWSLPMISSSQYVTVCLHKHRLLKRVPFLRLGTQYQKALCKLPREEELLVVLSNF